MSAATFNPAYDGATSLLDAIETATTEISSAPSTSWGVLSGWVRTAANTIDRRRAERFEKSRSETRVGIHVPVVTQTVAPERAAVLERERGEVERAKAGDRHALGEILRRYGPILFRTVLLPRLGSQAAAEEALSMTYARVVEKIATYTWQDAGIYPWLRVIAMRIAIDGIRTRKREVLFEADDLEREIDATERDSSEGRADAMYLARSDEREAKTRVEQALTQLHPRYAAAIRLRVLEERSREEVARELGVTVATFDVVLHRAMAAMRKVLASTQEEP
ncbi:MAG: RNA polymerase sigma factor [Polyangiaceae bacterium]